MEAILQLAYELTSALCKGFLVIITKVPNDTLGVHSHEISRMKRLDAQIYINAEMRYPGCLNLQSW